MAEMSGVELAVALQAERPGLLVVLVSGNVEASVLEDLEPGTAAFVAKPFRPSELIGVLAELRKGR
jgi:FixJ family two-component response regulator